MASYGAAGATIFSWMTGVPFLLTLQEGNDVRRGVRTMPVLRQIYRMGFRSADGLQAISKYLLDWGISMGFRNSRPAELIPNGVDVELFTEELLHGAVAAERAAYHVPNNAFVLTTVSRLVPKNGVGDIIRALACLPARFVLVIHGFGPLESALTAEAQKLGVAERVRFQGPLARERLPIALRAADLFVRPSLTEGLGTAFLEAMAAGTLVVATPVGGIPDFLHDGENGFFAPPGNPTQLAKIIERVALLDEQHKADIKNRALETVFKNYSWDDIAKRMDHLFSQLIR
jgi:glycosyltransferase involved in cell wall biosynthesis